MFQFAIFDASNRDAEVGNVVYEVGCAIYRVNDPFVVVVFAGFGIGVRVFFAPVTVVGVFLRK